MAELSNVSVTVVQTGMGVQKAKSACKKILAKNGYNLAISSGFAGALIPSSIGSLVIPEAAVLGVRDRSEEIELSSFPCSVEYHQIIRRMVEGHQPPWISGLLVTVPWIVCTAMEKKGIAQRYQANALDMESTGIAAIAKDHEIPFLVVRTVSDLVDENLPEAFNLFLSPSTWIHGVWCMVSQPRNWAQVYRLRGQTKVASKELTNFFDTFFPHLIQQ